MLLGCESEISSYMEVTDYVDNAKKCTGVTISHLGSFISTYFAKSSPCVRWDEEHNISSDTIDISTKLYSVVLRRFFSLSINSRVIEKGRTPIAVLFVNTLSAWERTCSMIGKSESEKVTWAIGGLYALPFLLELFFPYLTGNLTYWDLFWDIPRAASI